MSGPSDQFSGGGQKKLTINTSISRNNSMFGSATPTSPSYFSSPVRRRNNYNTGEMGPFFTQTKQLYKLWNVDRSKSVKVTLQAKVDKGFFLTENDWTCYRRNYFQVSGAFSCYTTSSSPMPMDPPVDFHPSHENPCFLELDDRVVMVSGFRIGVGARVATSDKIIELVQHTSKRDKGPQLTPSPKALKPGGNLMQSQLHHLLASAQVSSSLANQTMATFERLQFKSATANNGKRRAAQQYYVIDLHLYAEIDQEIDGSNLIKVATITSAPLVVRGRSPGHYADTDRLQSPYGLLAATAGYAADSGALLAPLGNDKFMQQPQMYTNSPFSAGLDGSRFMSQNMTPMMSHQGQLMSPSSANSNSQHQHEFSKPLSDLNPAPFFSNMNSMGSGAPMSTSSSLFSTASFASMPGAMPDNSPGLYAPENFGSAEPKITYDGFNENGDGNVIIGGQPLSGVMGF